MATLNELQTSIDDFCESVDKFVAERDHLRLRVRELEEAMESISNFRSNGSASEVIRAAFLAWDIADRAMASNGISARNQRIQELEEALNPFADAAENAVESCAPDHPRGSSKWTVEYDDLEAAYAAMCVAGKRVQVAGDGRAA